MCSTRERRHWTERLSVDKRRCTSPRTRAVRRWICSSNLPANAHKPAPLLLNLSFAANSSTVDDPGVKPGEIWGRDKKKVPASSGRSFGKLNVAPFLAAGFGVATVYYGDIDPDFEGGVPYGVRVLYPSAEWGSIAAWAWGLSRALDYLETDKGVD